MNNNQEFCPQCPNHCHKDELRCGRGKAFFGMEEGHSHTNNQPLTGIAGQLKQCGHIMHHNPDINNERLCVNLSKEEQETLERLLNKILKNI